MAQKTLSSSSLGNKYDNGTISVTMFAGHSTSTQSRPRALSQFLAIIKMYLLVNAELHSITARWCKFTFSLKKHNTTVILYLEFNLIL